MSTKPTNSSNKHQDPDLWFEDGNLIIRAGTRKFRVHRGILVARSTSFKKFFDNAYARDGPHTGSEVAHLSLNENALDFRVLLMGIYDPSFYESPPNKVSFKDTLAMARMSSRYGVDFLFQRAIKHLNRAFPTSLAGWDDRSANTIQDFGKTTVSGFMEALQTVMATRAIWLMPAVLYNCFFFDISSIMATKTWEVYRNASNSMAGLFIQAYGKHRLLDRRMLVVFAHLPDVGCHSKEHCRKLANNWYLDWLDLTPNNPLTRSLRPLWRKYLQSLCAFCFKRYMELNQKAREEIWEDLPKVYEMDNGWDTLRSLSAKVATHLTDFPQETDQISYPNASETEETETQDGKD